MINDMCKDEAFKKWCFDTELVINKSWFDLENPSGDEVYIAYEAWCASASREGYKLVPVEPPEDMDIKICRLVDHRIDVFEADRIYKAMIEQVNE